MLLFMEAREFYWIVVGWVNTGVEGPFLKTQSNDRGRQTGRQDAGSKRDDQGDTSTSGRLRGRPVLP